MYSRMNPAELTQLLEAQTNASATIQRDHTQALLDQQRTESAAVALRHGQAAVRKERKEAVDKAQKMCGKCDGSTSSQLRTFFREVEMARQYLPLANREVDTMEVIERTVAGEFWQAYETFMQAQPNRQNVTWNAVRLHLRHSFLSADEDERLRTEVGRLTQTQRETVPQYGRRALQLAEEAYPAGIRNAEIERIIMQSFITGLRKEGLRDRLIEEGRPNDLGEAIGHLEQYSLDDERKRRMKEDRSWRTGPVPMEIGENYGEVGEVEGATAGAASKMKSLVDQVGGLRKELAALKVAAAQKEGQGGNKPWGRREGFSPQQRRGEKATRKITKDDWTADGQPICFGCNRPGHLRRECEVVCYACDQLGHLAKNCPKNRKKTGTSTKNGSRQ